jgi:hypothetical protein
MDVQEEKCNTCLNILVVVGSHQSRVASFAERQQQSKAFLLGVEAARKKQKKGKDAEKAGKAEKKRLVRSGPDSLPGLFSVEPFSGPIHWTAYNRKFVYSIFLSAAPG